MRKREEYNAVYHLRTAHTSTLSSDGPQCYLNLDALLIIMLYQLELFLLSL